MKRATIIYITNGTDSLRKEMYESFAPLVPTMFSKDLYINGGRLEIPLEENSESFIKALTYTEKHKLRAKLISKVYYTKKEIDEIPFFEMRILSPLEREGTSAADYGTIYENICPVCHLGGTPSADVRVDRKFIHANASIGHLLPDTFVSEEVKNLICQHDFTGVNFQGKVTDWKNREMRQLFVMNVLNRLPPMNETVWKEFEETCSNCGKTSFYVRSDLRYERNKLKDAKDFNLSQEYLDAWKIPAIIVSAKVRKCFMTNKVRAGFVPITIL